MPIYLRTDSNGHYFRYGKTGKKYYFKRNSVPSIIKAYDKCLKQANAIRASRARERNQID